MNPIPEIFNSKLLLFGEYGLMFDAMALSVPYTRFYGSLEFDTDGRYRESNAEIRNFFAYLTSLNENKLHYPFDLKDLKEDLNQGLCFNSNIPHQYGLGSSGALVAALFSRYAASSLEKEHLPIHTLKEDFSLLESYFHGKSSGLDPLVSFLNQPLLLGEDKTIQPLAFDLSKSGWPITLIDTKTTGATGPLVQHFIDCMKLTGFNKAFLAEYIPASNGCIQSLLSGDKTSFFIYLRQLIEFELQYLKEMFPLDFGALVKEALNQQVYIKLLGSGGGGYLLAFAPDEDILNLWSERKAFPLIKVA
ncbi:MAG: hypothetical protein ACM3PR_08525 [Bacteroidales bacterium]